MKLNAVCAFVAGSTCDQKVNLTAGVERRAVIELRRSAANVYSVASSLIDAFGLLSLAQVRWLAATRAWING